MRIGRRQFVAALAGAAAMASASNEAAYVYNPANWQRMRDGLEFSRMDVYSNGKIVDTLAVLRADPERNTFRLSYDGRQRRTADDWQRYLGADAVFNAGFYRYSGRKPGATEPAALVISDGNPSGPRANRKVRGAFVSEPKSGRKPYARVIDMDHDSGQGIYQWNTCVQSWPMLVHSTGALAPSGPQRDSRTAVCEDGYGRILAVTTEDNNLTLNAFARALRVSELGVKRAVNLDGGHAAQMYISCGGFNYAVYGKEKSSFGIPIIDSLVSKVRIPIPGVISISERR